MNRIIVEYDGGFSSRRDAAIDDVAERLGLLPGDTGYDYDEGIRDHSIAAGDDLKKAYSLCAEFRRSLPWARVTVWTEDDV